MASTLAALLGHGLDFAGTFPPARMDLSAAWSDYQAVRKSRDQWILGAFTLDAKDLDAAQELIPREESDLSLAVIGRSGAWEDARSEDAEALARFDESVGRYALITSYEVTVPSLLEAASCAHSLSGFQGIDRMLELPLEDGIEDVLIHMATLDDFVAKARAGGEMPSQTPAPEALANFIHQCLCLDLPFKISGGLSHLFAAPTELGRVRHHGLVNVCAAAAFCVADDLSVREVATILQAPRDVWEINGREIRCLDYVADLDAIETSRDFLQSVGSVSLAEPLAELQEHGWIPA